MYYSNKEKARIAALMFCAWVAGTVFVTVLVFTLAGLFY